jgi:hypothetical protein
VSIIDDIETWMMSDTEDREDQSARLVDDYKQSNNAERRAVDRALVCICGYSLETLILNGNIEEDEPEDLDFEDAA